MVGHFVVTDAHHLDIRTVVRAIARHHRHKGTFLFFAGKGVLELVEGKLFQPTLINGMPEISWLGIYPYVETLLPQIVLLIAALVALWIMRRRQAPGETIKTSS